MRVRQRRLLMALVIATTVDALLIRFPGERRLIAERMEGQRQRLEREEHQNRRSKGGPRGA